MGHPSKRRLALLVYDVVEWNCINEPGFESAVSSLNPGFLLASLPRTLLFTEMRKVAFETSNAGAKPSVVDPQALGSKPVKTGSSSASKASKRASRVSGSCVLPRLVPDGVSPGSLPL